MTLPNTIRFGAADYRVIEKRHLEPLGQTRNNDSKILIKPSQSPANMRDTVLHEAIHAIIWLSGACIIFALGAEDEEKLVRILTPWLLALIRDNPDLIQYLTEQ